MAKKPKDRGKRPASESVPEASKPVETSAQPNGGATPEAGPRVVIAAVLAFLVPGAGHLFLKRIGRGLLLAGVVVTMLVIGWRLDGQLPATFSGSPLLVLQSLGAAGSGIFYWVLLRGLGYVGDPRAPGFEYGGAFLITAGVLNLLLVLDAWDLGLGVKE